MEAKLGPNGNKWGPNRTKWGRNGTKWGPSGGQVGTPWEPIPGKDDQHILVSPIVPTPCKLPIMSAKFDETTDEAPLVQFKLILSVLLFKS